MCILGYNQRKRKKMAINNFFFRKRCLKSPSKPYYTLRPVNTIYVYTTSSTKMVHHKTNINETVKLIV